MNNIKETFKKRKKRQIIIAIPLVLAVFYLGFSSEQQTDVAGNNNQAYVTIACIVLVTCGVILSLINWRCPSCNKYLGKKFSPKFCSSCGTALL